DAASRRLTGLIDLNSAVGQQGSAGDLLLFGDHALVLMQTPMMYAVPMPAKGVVGGGATMEVPVSGSELVLVNLAGPPTVLSTVHVGADLLDARQTGSPPRVGLRPRPPNAV